MVQTFGSFDGQKRVGMGNAYDGKESSGRWSSIPMLWKPGGSPPAFFLAGAVVSDGDEDQLLSS